MGFVAEEINEKAKEFSQNVKVKQIFDPRILDNTGAKGQMLWSTDSVDLAINGLSEGYKLKEYPFLKKVKGALLRREGLPFKYTEDELKVLEICADDKMFFCNNFGKLKDAEKGWINIKLRDYQTNLLERYTNNRWNIIMFPRQSGKTTTTVLEILHFCCFNIDKDCVVIAQSDKVVNEILGKIKEAFAGLPFFMQPGFVKFTRNGFVLDNGCRLSIGIASESVVQGFSLDLLYIDEFAYIKPSLVRKFWDNIYPSLTNNPNSRCIITSTPNGRNMFWELWVAAESKLNKFKAYRIYWYDVPGRDEQFKYDTIVNSSIEAWEMGFECSFDTQLKSVFSTINQKYLRKLQLDNKEKWSKDNNPFGNKFNMEFINTDYIKYNLFTDFFTLSIDLGEGLEQDSTIAKLKKIVWDKDLKKLRYISVGVFRDNTIAIEDFSEWLLNFVLLFQQKNIRVVVENNTYGGELFAHLKYLRMQYPQKYKKIENSIFAKFTRNSKDDFELGIRWNSQNKKLAVKSFTNLVSTKIIEESHYISIEEYLNFGRLKNGTYAAQYGHDDLVMADVTLSYFIKSSNIYTKEFLDYAILRLRVLYNDEDPEIVRVREEKINKEKNKYRCNGFTMRDSTEKVDQHINDDIYLFEV